MFEKSSRLLIGILSVIICILLILVFVLTEMNNQDKLQNPEVTLIATPIATVTPTSESTKRPTTIIIVTMTPTVTPTATPTIEFTATPTVDQTATPTIEPTLTLTTAEPTDNNVEKIRKELSKLTMDGGIYIDYDMQSKHDLYESINVVGISDDVLFSELKKPFLDGIVNWTNMQFVKNNSSIAALSEALNCSICSNCGRVLIRENHNNLISALNLFEQISNESNFKVANDILLNYLYEYTTMNPTNPNERLILACKCE